MSFLYRYISNLLSMRKGEKLVIDFQNLRHYWLSMYRKNKKDSVLKAYC